MKPYFLNAQEGTGYNLRHIRDERWGFFWYKSIYEFTLVEETPLTLVTDEGYFQPDRHQAETDLGSVPPPLHGIISPTHFRLEYLFHDNIVSKGGLWFCKVLDGVYGFKEITFRQGNIMLHSMVRAKSKVRAILILVGVFTGRICKRR
jgi:hypothetical protein